MRGWNAFCLSGDVSKDYMKSLWKGALSFGLVNIPVQLYSATVSHALDLDMLDDRDNSHIRYHRVNEKTGKEVPWEHIVKGYLLDEEYVVLNDADFEEASPRKSKMIEIEEFVDASEVSTMFYDTPYYIVPDKGNSKAYELFLKALQKTGKVGIARFVMRSAENLALVQAENNFMILNKIRFPDEIRPPDDLDLPAAPGFGKAEMDMAVSLIKQYTTSFEPDKFKNEYKDELLRIIQEKAKGKRPVIRKLKLPKSSDDNLLEQLKASLSASKKVK